MSSRVLLGSVVSVSRDAEHRFSKPPVEAVTLLAGLGIEGDAHAGTTVRHRYLVKKDPKAPNLTQVHLLQAELFPELAERGFAVGAGDLGENITTTGLDLLTVPVDTLVHLGADAVVRVTGLRSPCFQINGLRKGLMKAVLAKDADGAVIRKSGIMSVVLAGGVVRPGDEIRLELPAGEHRPMGVV